MFVSDVKTCLLLYTETNHQENLSVKFIPLKLHFYKYKVVYLDSLIIFQNIDYGYLLEPSNM